MMVTREVSRHSIKKIHISRNGGYVAYFKLYPTLWRMLYNAPLISKPKKIGIGFLLILQTPWWLILKPLGVLFSTKSLITGTYERVNGQFSKMDLEKTLTLRFLGIPVGFWFPKLNEDDIKNLA